MRLPEDFREGQRLDARELNQIRQELERLAKITATPPLNVVSGEAGFEFELLDAVPITIKITGGGTSGKYAWTKQLPVAGGGWTNDTATGTVAADPAIETNGNATIPVNTIIFRAYRDRPTGELRFERGSC